MWCSWRSHTTAFPALPLFCYPFLSLTDPFLLPPIIYRTSPISRNAATFMGSVIPASPSPPANTSPEIYAEAWDTRLETLFVSTTAVRAEVVAGLSFSGRRAPYTSSAAEKAAEAATPDMRPKSHMEGSATCRYVAGAPAAAAASASALVRGCSASTVWVSLVVMEPMPIKVRTWNKERGENRARPQMPWPEVQPFPHAAPTPSVSPAANARTMAIFSSSPW